MEPIIGMNEPYPLRYRNKGQFPFGRAKDGRIIYGFYAGRTHSIIETEDCLLGAPVNGRFWKRSVPLWKNMPLSLMMKTAASRRV